MSKIVACYMLIKKNKIKIGKNVTIGHSAVVHGATIGDECLIGIHATVLNGAKIGNGSIIGANALITAGMDIPKNSLVLGIPGKIVKNDKEFGLKAIQNAKEYQRLTKEHKEGKHIRYPSID